jgi:hypothetical protein
MHNGYDRFVALTPTDVATVEYGELDRIATTPMVASLIDQLIHKVIQHTVYALVEYDDMGIITAADIVALNPGTESMRSEFDLSFMPDEELRSRKFYKKIDIPDPKELYRMRESIRFSLLKLLRLYLTYGTVYYRIMLRYDMLIRDYTVYADFCDAASRNQDSIFTYENAKTQFRLINFANIDSVIDPIGVPISGWHPIIGTAAGNETDIFNKTTGTEWRRSHVARAAPLVMAIIERLYVSNVGAINASMLPNKILRDTQEDMTGARIENHNLNNVVPDDDVRSSSLTIVQPPKDSTVTGRAECKQGLGRLQRMLDVTALDTMYRLPKNTDRIGPDRNVHVDDFQTTMEVYHRHLTFVFAQAPNILIPRAPNHNKSTQSRGRDASDEQGDVQIYIHIANIFFESFEKVYKMIRSNTYPVTAAKDTENIKYGICLYFKGMLDLSDRIRLTGGPNSIETEIELQRAIINAKTQISVARIQAEASIQIAKSKSTDATNSAAKKKKITQ